MSFYVEGSCQSVKRNGQNCRQIVINRDNNRCRFHQADRYSQSPDTSQTENPIQLTRDTIGENDRLVRQNADLERQIKHLNRTLIYVSARQTPCWWIGLYTFILFVSIFAAFFFKLSFDLQPLSFDLQPLSFDQPLSFLTDPNTSTYTYTDSDSMFSYHSTIFS